MEGMCNDLPTIGQEFRMINSYLRTTEVKAISRIGDTITFQTQNSTYAVHIENEFDDEAPSLEDLEQQLDLEF